MNLWMITVAHDRDPGLSILYYVKSPFFVHYSDLTGQNPTFRD